MRTSGHRAMAKAQPRRESRGTQFLDPHLPNAVLASWFRCQDFKIELFKIKYLFPTSLGRYGNIWSSFLHGRVSLENSCCLSVSWAGPHPSSSSHPRLQVGAHPAPGCLDWACFILAHTPASPAFAGTDWGGPVESPR